jgi:large subunit ribosomal protein L23
MDNVLKSPLVTEKNTYHSAAGVYVFEVGIKSDKVEIKAAVESKFGVKVIGIRTAIARGRPKMTKFGAGKTPYWKKAYVKLAAGEKIALFEGA